MRRIKESIPSNICKLILQKEKELEGKDIYRHQTRWYPYLEMQGSDVAISTVAVKRSKKNTLYIKKVTTHIVGDKKCYLRDIDYRFIAGYVAEFYKETSQDSKSKRVIKNCYCGSRWTHDSKYYRLFNYQKVINPEFLQSVEEFKYCGFDNNGCDILKYLEMYRENPKIELISKLIGSSYAVKKSIVGLAQKDKQFVAWLRRNKPIIDSGHYSVPCIVDAYKKRVLIPEMCRRMEALDYVRRNTYHKTLYNWCKENVGRFDRIAEYMRKKHISIHQYEDYFNACVYIGLQMEDTKNAFPNDWEYWREVRENQRAAKKALEDRKARRERNKKMKAIARKYATLANSENAMFAVVIADSKKSLIREGKASQHCVGRMDYDERILKESSLIFFIRKADEMDKPYVTVEFLLESASVRQCYGFDDDPPDDETRNFVYNEWAPFARKELKRLKNKTLEVEKAA